jgi:hypothetical protein
VIQPNSSSRRFGGKAAAFVGRSLAVAALAAFCAAPGPVAAQAPRLLTVLEPHAKPGEAMYDGGSLAPQTPGPVEHVFVLRNTTGVALTLDRLEPACDCTTAALVGDPPPAAPVVLAPGRTISVRVSVNPQGLSPGLWHESVWVFVQGQAAPAATLEMTGALLPGVDFSPPSLNFGRLEKGTVLTLLLTATPHAARLEEGTELRLVSPDPDIQVSEVPPESPATSPKRSFRVRLDPHAQAGRLQGKLSLVLALTGDPAGGNGPVAAAVAWQAEAAGDVAAFPPIVAFGVPAAGQALTRKVVLTGKGLTLASKAFVFTSSSPYVSAVFHTLPSRAETKGDAQVEMDVHLDPHTPPGPLEARLTVTTPGGELLVLPVYAVVPPRKP